MSNTLWQFIVFSAIGVVGTAGHYATLIVLVELITTSPVVATTIGFVVGALINYILNYHITFQSSKPHRETMTKFFIVAAFGAIFNTLIMYVGFNILEYYYLAVQVIATIIVLLWNFAVNKVWTFSHVKQSA